MKQRMQSMVIGFLLAVLLLGTVTIVTANTRTIEATYGVNIVVNGVQQVFSNDMMPFTSEGRTFLPVRGIADALGLDIEWVGATQTVYLTTPAPLPAQLPTIPTPDPIPAPIPTPVSEPTPVSLNIAAPMFDSNTSGGRGGGGAGIRHDISNVYSVTMGGMNYNNAVLFNAYYLATIATVPSNEQTVQFSLHNLNNQYRTLTGYVGRVDGSLMVDATFNIFGDGQLLQTRRLSAQELPTTISIDVTDIRQLRIEFVHGFPVGQPRGDVSYAFVGLVE